MPARLTPSHGPAPLHGFLNASNVFEGPGTLHWVSMARRHIVLLALMSVPQQSESPSVSPFRRRVNDKKDSMSLLVCFASFELSTQLRSKVDTIGELGLPAKRHLGCSLASNRRGPACEGAPPAQRVALCPERAAYAVWVAAWAMGTGTLTMLPHLLLRPHFAHFWEQQMVTKSIVVVFPSAHHWF